MIYFDNAASAPLDGQVLAAMMPYLTEKFGNPSSLHAAGREARSAVERSREKIARTLHADPREIVFTSGGTESVNMAHKGAAWAFQGRTRHVVLSAVEHHCVLECAGWLSRQGIEVTLVPVDAEGRVDPQEVQKAVRPGETGLISVMAANNEVGTLQPFREIGKMAREQGILFHTDAVQAYGKIDLDVRRDHIDFLSVSGHKIYGPKGTGFLYQRQGLELVPLVHGGGQERDRRGGTENVAGLVGLGAAAEKICGESGEGERLRAMAEDLLAGIRRRLPDARVNGPRKAADRVPGLLNLTFPGLEGAALVQGLDAQGLAASSGAACAAGAAPPSHVLLAMGRSAKEAHQGLRLSLGRFNSPEEVRRLAEILPTVVEKLRAVPSFLEDGE
jgi:cysteine desulfurase